MRSECGSATISWLGFYLSSNHNIGRMQNNIHRLESTLTGRQGDVQIELYTSSTGSVEPAPPTLPIVISPCFSPTQTRKGRKSNGIPIRRHPASSSKRGHLKYLTFFGFFFLEYKNSNDFEQFTDFTKDFYHTYMDANGTMFLQKRRRKKNIEVNKNEQI